MNAKAPMTLRELQVIRNPITSQKMILTSIYNRKL